jgi:hypothetical protein
MNLKEALLSFDGVIDNEYLDRYIELVSGTYSFSENDYTEKHHVIPALFYQDRKTSNLSVWQFRHSIVEADQRNSIVLLLFKDHCKAHWLLYKCTLGRIRAANAIAFCTMTSSKNKLLSGLSAAEYQELQRIKDELKANSGHYWTKEQDEWLITNSDNYTIKECAEILSRSYGAVRARRLVLGLTTRASVKALQCDVLDTQQDVITRENAWLLQNYLTTSVEECCEILGLTKTTLYNRALSLGLKRGYGQCTKGAVRCITTGEVFKSANAAAKHFGLCTASVLLSLQKCISVGKHHGKKYLFEPFIQEE